MAVVAVSHSLLLVALSATVAALPPASSVARQEEERTSAECATSLSACILKLDPVLGVECLKFEGNSTCCGLYSTATNKCELPSCNNTGFDEYVEQFCGRDDSKDIFGPEATASPEWSDSKEHPCQENVTECVAEYGGNRSCLKESESFNPKCCREVEEALYCAETLEVEMKSCAELVPLLQQAEKRCKGKEENDYDDDEEDEEDEEGGLWACFPGSAQVQLSHGRTRSMRSLNVGDHIAVGGGRFSPVFFFSHRAADGLHPFVRLTTTTSTTTRSNSSILPQPLSLPPLTVSASHYIHTTRGLVAAGRVRAGDAVVRTDGSRRAVVTQVDRVVERGLFNPHTVHGDLVVDGYVVSSYTTAVEPRIAAAALAPVRWAYAAGLSVSGFLDGSVPDGLKAVVPRGQVSRVM